MATIRFTDNIQRHVKCPDREVAGESVREVLESYFQSNEKARGYVLDDQDRLRKHMAIFVDGKPVTDRRNLSDPVEKKTTVDVMQALSGG